MRRIQDRKVAHIESVKRVCHYQKHSNLGVIPDREFGW